MNKMKANNIRLYASRGLGALTVLALTAVSLCITSCDDDLSALPTQYKVDGNVVVDGKSAEVLLNGMYYEYAMADYDVYENMSTGCFYYYCVFPSNMAGAITYYQGAYMLETHGYTYYSVYSPYIWTGIFSAMNAANCVIDQVGAADDDWFEDGRKQEILGEAYAMRALTLYDELRIFGYSWDTSSPYGCIIRTEPSTTSNQAVARSTVAESYDQILSDLEYAIENAPDENEHYYITKWFAKGLKARVLMLRGEGTDYADAAELANEVINCGYFALEPNYTDIFFYEGNSSGEVIFGIEPYENQVDVYEALVYYSSAQWLPTDNFAALFEGDPRESTTFAQTSTMQIDWADDYSSYTITYVLKSSMSKFIDPDVDEANTIEETVYNMRLSEMYLIRAEALVRSGGSYDEARELLKEVLYCAGYDDVSFVDEATTEDELLQQIFNEQMRNLVLECGRELDYMLRYDDIALDFNPEYADPQYNVFPLPTDEFEYNSALTADDQNPGWSAE